jgi:hypothetical protein
VYVVFALRCENNIHKEIKYHAGYVGGIGDERGWAIADDATGSAYINGFTDSSESSFPVKVGPDLTYNEGQDAYIVRIQPDGAGLIYSGYVGGIATDWTFGIAVDAAGYAGEQPTSRSCSARCWETCAMQTIEVPAPLDCDPATILALIERIVRDAGLLADRRELRSYPGATHWHIRQPGAKGTLELTYWPRTGQLWFAIHANRRAEWIAPAIDDLMARLHARQSLR